MDKIIINGLEVYAYHGVNPEEKRDGQNFVINAELFVDLTTPCSTDSLKDTVNYSKAIKLITKVMIAEKYDLIERAAQCVAEGLLNEYPQVQKVKLTLKKPNAPIKADFNYVAVEIERERQSD
ncbi:MAG: dihydroneopterin aldolase [Clostridiales bacterium]|nr:dihydroneopterin aldolase [Clostridiales bacterium]